MKAGFEGDRYPATAFPSIVRSIGEQYQIGDEAKNCNITIQDKVMAQGRVNDWDGLEKLWNHVFCQMLRVEPEQYAILVADPMCVSDKQRNDLIADLFECFNVPFCGLYAQSALSLYSYGLQQGVVVDIGDDQTTVEPYFAGLCHIDVAERSPVAGRSITNSMHRAWSKAGCHGRLETELTYAVKEAFVCVAEHSAEIQPQQRQRQQSCVLPDGTPVTLPVRDCLECGEELFACRPDSKGLSNMVTDCIQSMPEHCRRALFKHIVLAGGIVTSME